MLHRSTSARRLSFRDTIASLSGGLLRRRSHRRRRQQAGISAAEICEPRQMLAGTMGPIFADPVEITGGVGKTIDATPELEWNTEGMSDVRSYEVYVGRPDEFGAVFRQTGITGGEFELPTPLEPGDYTVWVRAHLLTGIVSRWGSPSELTIGALPEVTATGDELWWDEVPGATSYTLWVDEINAAGARIQRQALFETDLQQTHFVLPATLDGGRYAVWVQAVREEPDDTFRTGWSRRQIVELTDAPAAPTTNEWNLTEYDVVDFAFPPENGEVTGQIADNLLRLTFGAAPAVEYLQDAMPDPMTGDVEYEFEIRGLASDNVLLSRRVFSTSLDLSMDDVSALSVETNSVRVRMRETGERWSEWSNAFVFNAGQVAPGWTDTPFVSTTGVFLNWADLKTRASFDEADIVFTDGVGVPDIEAQAPQYEVQVIDAATQVVVFTADEIELSQYLVRDALASGRYLAQVRGVYGDGTATPWSAGIEFLILHPTIEIDPPVQMSIDETPTLLWQPVENATGYTIVITQQGRSGTAYRADGVTETSHRVASRLSPGTYRVYLRAHFADGSFARWGEGTELTIGDLPVVEADNRLLIWNSIEGATYYELWVNRVDRFGLIIQEQIVYESRLTNNLFVLPDSLPEGRYSVWVRALRDEAGQTYRTAWSQRLDIDLTSLEDLAG